MVYADYEFYSQIYLGATITEEAFPKLALRASAFLDYYTQGKAEKNAELNALKMACCSIAEQYKLIDDAQLMANKSLEAAIVSGGEIQSESVGSWSRTYKGKSESATAAAGFANDAKSELANIARQYLSVTGLLYRGRRCCK